MTHYSDDRFLVKLNDGTILGPVAATSSLRNLGRRSGFILLGGGHALFKTEIEPTQWFENGVQISSKTGSRAPASGLDIREIAILEESTRWNHFGAGEWKRIKEATFSENVVKVLEQSIN